MIVLIKIIQNWNEIIDRWKWCNEQAHHDINKCNEIFEITEMQLEFMPTFDCNWMLRDAFSKYF